MIRVGPLFFGGTRGGHGRNYNSGSNPINREGAPRHGAHLLPTNVAHLNLPRGGVYLGDKEDGRDGGSGTIRGRRPSGSAAAGKPGTEGLEKNPPRAARRIRLR
jgi:hypothetical protein